jgi:hypothetical protein
MPIPVSDTLDVNMVVFGFGGQGHFSFRGSEFKGVA